MRAARTVARGAGRDAARCGVHDRGGDEQCGVGLVRAVGVEFVRVPAERDHQDLWHHEAAVHRAGAAGGDGAAGDEGEPGEVHARDVYVPGRAAVAARQLLGRGGVPGALLRKRGGRRARVRDGQPREIPQLAYLHGARRRGRSERAGVHAGNVHDEAGQAVRGAVLQGRGARERARDDARGQHRVAAAGVADLRLRVRSVRVLNEWHRGRGAFHHPCHPGGRVQLCELRGDGVPAQHGGSGVPGGTRGGGVQARGAGAERARDGVEPRACGVGIVGCVSLSPRVCMQRQQPAGIALRRCHRVLHI